jgi:hypothetical protein
VVVVVGAGVVVVVVVVIDKTGESVIGASIQVKGTTQGTITDIDGKFSLGVPDKKSVIVISFIGYATKELQVDPSKPMSIVLEEDTKVLDEVVVVGYQEVRKKDLTGSVAKADMNELLNTPVGSFDQTLGGDVLRV